MLDAVARQAHGRTSVVAQRLGERVRPAEGQAGRNGPICRIRIRYIMEYFITCYFKYLHSDFDLPRYLEALGGQHEPLAFLHYKPDVHASNGAPLRDLVDRVTALDASPRPSTLCRHPLMSQTGRTADDRELVAMARGVANATAAATVPSARSSWSSAPAGVAGSRQRGPGEKFAQRQPVAKAWYFR